MLIDFVKVQKLQELHKTQVYVIYATAHNFDVPIGICYIHKTIAFEREQRAYKAFRWPQICMILKFVIQCNLKESKYNLAHRLEAVLNLTKPKNGNRFLSLEFRYEV